MRAHDPERIEDLFHAALELPEAQRTTYLDRACRGDDDLKSDLASLLDADHSAAGFLERPAGPFSLASVPFDPHLGRTIGAYRVVRLIAWGGMGAVYEAQQRQPQRRVALKLIRSALASPAARQRFEYEAEVLGWLRHPGVAQVYEAGLHRDAGADLPYFVMEYIPDALCLIDFARQRRLGLREKLSLFCQVCDAVHHGHQQGVVHLDLKPGNILVDTGGRAKVIDFGVAKAADAQRPVGPANTSLGPFIGTPSYMSPEQFDGDPRTVDVRSDVYSLGVVLYELLAGKRPHFLSGLPLEQAARIVQGRLAPRLRSIDRAFRGDLDAIVAKALEPDRSRRYQSASALAEDIQRFLGGRPIEARSPTAPYHLSKFVSRHRAASGLVAVLGLALIAFVIVLWVQSDELARQRDEATEQARKAQRIAAFLEGTLVFVDPTRDGQELSRAELLAEAGRRIDQELAEEPSVRAMVQERLGCIYSRLGKYQEAERLLQSALTAFEQISGADSRDVANATYSLACNYCEKGELAKAYPLWRRAYDLKRRHYGDDDPRTAYLLCFLAKEQATGGDLDRADSLLRQAEGVLRRHGAAGSVEMAIALDNRAGVAAQRKDSVLAEQLFRQALAIKRDALGPAHWEVCNTLNNLAELFLDQQRFEEAEATITEALTVRRRLVGDRHLRVAEEWCRLGEALLALGKPQQAEQAWRNALDIQQVLLGEDDPHVARTKGRLSSLGETRQQAAP